MQHLFEEFSKGNDTPFVETMADDIQWIWMGSGLWSRTFDGKQAVLDEL
ncbi:nuclear transport factor 2-like protein [Parachryseolinea silvisoli]|nr:hypothetical protein [Parachryseolinea silvisoli]MCD9015485.1 hypothetical protein [Parachryseolinea silvisoli]